jgi:hypothetical protein
MNWKWIVIENEPTAQGYIAVIAVHEDHLVKKIMGTACSIFESSDKALIRAKRLREKFNVNKIRILSQEVL